MSDETESPPTIRHRLGMVLGPAVFVLVLVTAPPEGMTPAAWRLAGVAALMAIWWITEAVAIPVTALLPLVLFPTLGITTMAATASPYANPVIFLFMGGFMLAIALERSGLHRRVALWILRIIGASSSRLVGGFMAATGFISLWISNTAAVLMMLPMAASLVALLDRELADRGGKSSPNLAIALYLGIAYAASIGGLGTLIGTPPNALLAGFMSESYGVEIGFLQWMMVGVPLVLVALPLAWLLLTRVVYPLPSLSDGDGVDGPGPTGPRATTALTALVESERASLGPTTRPEVVVGTVTTLTAMAWMTRPLLEKILPGLNDSTISIAGALALFLFPVDWRRGRFALHWRDAEQLPWAVLLLFGGGLSLAGAFESTGLALWIGGAMSGVAALPVLLVVASVTVIVLLLTELTSNTATSATFLPIIGALAISMGLDPLRLTAPAALAATCAFMLPVGTPPNAIVYGTGRVTIGQMVRAGVWMNTLLAILIVVVTTTLLPLVF